MSLKIKSIIKHLSIFTVVSGVFIAIVYINSFNTTLHPDAYKDAVMSVVYVYGFFLAVYIPIKHLNNKKDFKFHHILKKIECY